MKNIDITRKHSYTFDETGITGYKQPTEYFLGNGRKIFFSSKRIARYFQSETNRFLTKCLVVLNATYADTFYQYRSAWLTTTNTKHGNGRNALEVERRVKSMLSSSTGDMLDKFNMTLHGSNDAFFSFIDLNKAAIFCGDAADELATYFRNRNYTNNAYECQMLADRCKSVLYNLKNYGADQQAKNPDPPPAPPKKDAPPRVKRRPVPYTMDNKPGAVPPVEAPITETQKEASTIGG